MCPSFGVAAAMRLFGGFFVGFFLFLGILLGSMFNVLHSNVKSGSWENRNVLNLLLEED